MELSTTIKELECLIDEVKRKYSLRSIMLVHEHPDTVSCKAFKYNGENFCFVGGDSLSAVNGVVKTIEEYARFKANVIDGQLKPDEPYTGVDRKYYLRPYTNFKDDYLIEGSDRVTLHWKYDDGHLFIVDVSFKRGDFFLQNPPCPIEEMGHTTYRLPDSSVLKDGEELWFWDDMQCLSGRGGDAIVKNGKVIASRTTMMS